MLLLLFLLLLTLCYLYLFFHRASSSFCSPATATFIVSWFLFFELVCNYMVIFFFNIIYHLYWKIVFYLFIKSYHLYIRKNQLKICKNCKTCICILQLYILINSLGRSHMLKRHAKRKSHMLV